MGVSHLPLKQVSWDFEVSASRSDLVLNLIWDQNLKGFEVWPELLMFLFKNFAAYEMWRETFEATSQIEDALYFELFELTWGLGKTACLVSPIACCWGGSHYDLLSSDFETACKLFIGWAVRFTWLKCIWFKVLGWAGLLYAWHLEYGAVYLSDLNLVNEVHVGLGKPRDLDLAGLIYEGPIVFVERFVVKIFKIDQWDQSLFEFL